MVKKIIFYTKNMSGGGAEKVIAHISNNFVSRGIRVELFLDEAIGTNLDYLDNLILVKELKYKNTILRILQLGFELRKRRADVFCTSLTTQNIIGFFASLIALRAKTHFARVAAHHSGSVLHAENMKKKFINFIFSKLARHFNFLIAVSESVQSDLITNFGVKENRVHSIANPYIETETPYQKESDKIIDDYRIVSVGRLVKQKNFQALITCFLRFNKIYPDSSLTIVGVGPEEAFLKRHANSLGLQNSVFFSEFQTNIIEFIKNFDLFVLTSLWEGSPNVILDALRADLPIVSTDSPGGSAELLNYGEHGTLVDVGDDEGLLNALLKHKTITKFKVLPSRISFLKNFQIPIVADRYLVSFGIMSDE